MNRPTASDVREWATAGDPTKRPDFASYGFPAGADPDPLTREVAVANAYVEQVTTRKLDATMPDELEPLAEEAVLLRTWQQVAGGTRKRVRTSTDESQIQTIRAGDYSETRRDPAAIGKAALVNEWPALSELLLLVAPEGRRAELIAQAGGQHAPAMAVGDIYGYPAGQSYLDDWGC